MRKWAKCLDEIGLRKGFIYESIVVTVSREGKPNFAPMGVRRLNNENLSLKIFKETKTLKNLLETYEATVNFIWDVELFYLCVFEKKKVLKDKVCSSLMVKPPRLKDAGVYIESSVRSHREMKNSRVEVVLAVKHVKAEKTFPKLLCRCDYAVIESLIHVTRIPVFLKKRNFKKAKDLASLIEHYSSLTQRVCPGSTHEKIMLNILKRTKKYLNNFDN